MERNRWLIAAAAVGIHICIGSVYAWSVLTKPVMASMGLSLSETTWAFSVAIFFLGMSAGFLGNMVERIGPKQSGLLSTGFFGAGMIGTGWAVTAGSPWLLYLFYGVIGGIGLGTGYITPVSTLVKWFPRHRGFATGLAIMGFGFASLAAGPMMQYLTAAYGLAETFWILGTIYICVMSISALYLRPPREGDAELSAVFKGEAKENDIRRVPSVTRRDAMRTWKWYALWWIFFTNITCGIGLLAVASPMAQETAGMTAAEAASLVGVIGIVNGAGRIAWSTISDIIGRGMTYILFFVLETAAFWQLAATEESWLFQTLVLVIISCYGGGFSCMPAYLSDIFGVKHLSAIHGSILTAWGCAGIAGPLLLAAVKESTGGYEETLRIFAVMLAIALLISFALWRSRGEVADTGRAVIGEAVK